MSDTSPEPPPAARSRPLISRQRLVELTVVVFGVVIALSLENIVEELRFRADARALERSFVTDLEGAVVLSLERQIVSPCLTERLRMLSERIATASDSLPPVAPHTNLGDFKYAMPQTYRAPSRIWITSSFDRALGSEAFKRIPADRAALYAGVFSQIETLGRLNEGEYLAIAGLAPLAFNQPHLDAQVRADVLKQIAALDRYNTLMVLASRQNTRAAFELPEIGQDIRRPFTEKEAKGFFATMTGTYGPCADLTVLDRLPPAA